MKLKFNKNDLVPMLKNVALVVLGTIILAFGTSVFQVPFDLIAGGMSGIAIVLVKIPTGVSFLTVDFYVWIMTIGFFILGFFLLGKNFAMKTLISTIVYPPAFSLCRMLVTQNAFGGLFNIGGTHFGAELVVAAVFGGIIVGTGVAISFLGGGSTGGIDIIALAIAKKVKKINSARILLVLDTSIILTGALVIQDLVITLLGVVSAFVSSIVIDKIFCGGSKAFIAHIISDKHEEINRSVIEEINRTATIVPCVGGYSGKEKKMLMVSFNMQQYSGLLAAVLRIDKEAFITVHKAHEINGEGWTWELGDTEEALEDNAEKEV